MLLTMLHSCIIYLIDLDAVRGMETSYDTARVSFPYIVLGETETMHNDHLRAHSCPPAAHTLSNDYLETEHVKYLMCTLHMLLNTRFCFMLYGLSFWY